MAHAFWQEANFWYLTGIDKPDWLLIVDGYQQKSWLVKPELDEIHRTFDGELDSNIARRTSGVDSVITMDEAMKLLRTLAKKHPVVHTVGVSPYAAHFNFTLNPSITRTNQMLERIFSRVQDCQKELNVLRAIKQPEEIDQIMRAVTLTTKAFEMVHQKFSRYKGEYELEADFTHFFRSHGAKGHAYDPVIASSVNACTLHYLTNQSRLTKRQLVLMDVGASLNGYAADITRTYAYGEPTKRQREVHSAVQTAHQQIIELIKPHGSVEQYHQQVETIMIEALQRLNLYKDETSLRRYFPHAISHGLGIDVHDSLGGPKQFEANMVLTVEPGIYIPEESIGVRIEDNILVTDHGYQNLSAKLSTGL